MRVCSLILLASTIAKKSWRVIVNSMNTLSQHNWSVNWGYDCDLCCMLHLAARLGRTQRVFFNLYHSCNGICWINGPVVDRGKHCHIFVFGLNRTLTRLPLNNMAGHFADDILICIFVNEMLQILIKNSLKFVPTDAVDNKPTLVKIMAWRRRGENSLSELILTIHWRIYAALGGDELKTSSIARVQQLFPGQYYARGGRQKAAYLEKISISLLLKTWIYSMAQSGHVCLSYTRFVFCIIYFHE